MDGAETDAVRTMIDKPKAERIDENVRNFIKRLKILQKYVYKIQDSCYNILENIIRL